MSDYQNDSLEIQVPVVRKGTPYDAGNYTDAKYEIRDRNGSSLFTGSLNTEITVVNQEFVVSVPPIDYSGLTFHEMRVWNVDGSTRTILKTQMQLNKTFIQPAQG